MQYVTPKHRFTLNFPEDGIHRNQRYKNKKCSMHYFIQHPLLGSDRKETR
jgi:hypothetical protein